MIPQGSKRFLKLSGFQGWGGVSGRGFQAVNKKYLGDESKYIWEIKLFWGRYIKGGDDYSPPNCYGLKRGVGHNACYVGIERLCSLLRRAVDWDSGELASAPTPTTDLLCVLGQVTSPICLSVLLPTLVCHVYLSCELFAS